MRTRSMYVIPDTALILDGSPQEYPLLLRDLPSHEKPREKLQAQGPEALTVKELLAVILNTGTTKEDVMEMSGRIIRDYGERSILAARDPEKLAQDMDIPIGKAFQIVATGELGRRYYDRSNTGLVTIRNARDVHEYLHDMRNLPKEHLRGLYLNTHNRIIRDEVISIGTINSNIIHPREVFKIGLDANAVAVILAHNHPSGEVAASEQDIEVTRQLVQAGKILGIRVLDHVIIAGDSYSSVSADY